MSMGLPTIATNWSGQTEFMNDQVSLPLKTDSIRLMNQRDMDDMFWKAHLPGHRFAEPSVAHLRKLMRWCYTNQAEAREMGQRARAHMRQNFSPEKVMKKIVKHLKKVRQRVRNPNFISVAWNATGKLFVEPYSSETNCLSLACARKLVALAHYGPGGPARASLHDKKKCRENVDCNDVDLTMSECDSTCDCVWNSVHGGCEASNLKRNQTSSSPGFKWAPMNETVHLHFKGQLQNHQLVLGHVAAGDVNGSRAGSNQNQPPQE